jgi:hypothetical protein
MPGSTTTADVIDIPLSSAAAAPKTLSRPIAAPHRLSFRKPDQQGNHAAVRQIDMRQQTACFNQDSVSDQFDVFETLAERAQLRRGQRRQQPIG